MVSCLCKSSQPVQMESWNINFCHTGLCRPLKGTEILLFALWTGGRYACAVAVNSHDFAGEESRHLQKLSKATSHYTDKQCSGTCFNVFTGEEMASFKPSALILCTA